jgi:hypothetical protein
MSPQEQIRLFTPDSEQASSPAQNSSSSSTALPDEPLIKIRSKDSGRLPDFRELWAHHELCYFLIWRDLKVRYKQAAAPRKRRARKADRLKERARACQGKS